VRACPSPSNTSLSLVHFLCMACPLTEVKVKSRCYWRPWCRAPSGSHDQMFVTVCLLFVTVCVLVGHHLWREDKSVSYQSQPAVVSQYFNASQSQSQKCITTDDDSAILSWNQARMWGPWPIVSSFLLLPLSSCGFVYVGHSLWREDGSVLNSCCCASAGQFSSGSSPARLMTIFYVSNLGLI
jgi:hypothetical protein